MSSVMGQKHDLAARFIGTPLILSSYLRIRPGNGTAMPLLSHDFSCVSVYTYRYDEGLERTS